MRRFRSFAFLFFLGISWRQVSVAQEQPKFYGVIIGVSQFEHLPQDDWLQFADADAPYSYIALGITYMEQQRWNEAITNFKSASERAGKWVYPHYNLARVFTGQKQYRQAEQEFRKGIELGTEPD